MEDNENIEDNVEHTLYYSDKRLSFGEFDLEEFRKDMDASKTGRKTLKERKVQRYKTWKEADLYIEYSPEKILSKYAGSTHPLINATLANALINSGQYEKGLSFLFDALLYSTNFPNLYWHSEYGMLGCSHALWTLAMLISNKKGLGVSNSLDWEKIEFRVNELLYMTMTRTIDMAPDLPQTCDLLVNRADLFWPRYNIGLLIFTNAGLAAASMEIQCLSDKYRAYMRASQIDSSLGGLYLQMLNEAIMMYQYGELRPINTDVSPMENTDAGFLDLVKFGYWRGDIVAMKEYARFSQNELGITKDELEEIIISLRQCFPDISPKEIFAQLFYILKESFEEQKTISVKKIMETLDSVKSKYGSQQVYKQIYSHASELLILRNVNSRDFLKSIIDEYKKVEKNYNFDKEITDLSDLDELLK